MSSDNEDLPTPEDEDLPAPALQQDDDDTFQAEPLSLDGLQRGTARHERAESSVAGGDLAGGQPDLDLVQRSLRRRQWQRRERGDDSFRRGYDDDEYDDDEDDAAVQRRGAGCWRTFCFVAALVSVGLLIALGYIAYGWFYPKPVGCSLIRVRPQKFKVDVTDFFKPKISAALQLVLSVQNSNFLRKMLLDECKVTVFEAATGLKLGSVHQSSLVVNQYSNVETTLSVIGLASSLPQQEQRRLATAYLAKKALLVTIVATATSRLPVKGSAATTTTSNSSRSVDFTALHKDPAHNPFFQRTPAPVEE